MGWTIGTEAWIWMGAWALLMVLVVWLLVREPRHETREDASAILRARFARGEITEEEFRRAYDALDADPVITASSNAHHRPAHQHHQGQEAHHD